MVYLDAGVVKVVQHWDHHYSCWAVGELASADDFVKGLEKLRVHKLLRKDLIIVLEDLHEDKPGGLQLQLLFNDHLNAFNVTNHFQFSLGPRPRNMIIQHQAQVRVPVPNFTLNHLIHEPEHQNQLISMLNILIVLEALLILFNYRR